MKKVACITLAALAALGLWWLNKNSAAKPMARDTIEIINDAKQAQQDNTKLQSTYVNDQEELEGAPQALAVGSNWKSR